MQKLNDTHEAYQVIVKVISAKNKFIKKAKETKLRKEAEAAKQFLKVSIK